MPLGFLSHRDLSRLPYNVVYGACPACPTCPACPMKRICYFIGVMQCTG